MSKILFISFLALTLVYGAAESGLSDSTETRKTKSMEIEDDEIELWDLPSWSSERGIKVLMNVDSFGAVGDGVSDDTKVNLLIFFPMRTLF